ncbi:MAG TPA: hypothetical protein ENK38_01335 [Gammaproteobacteria bacterium]|nr:hypothetical protein [Gammaproteobacteria bacterium]
MAGYRGFGAGLNQGFTMLDRYYAGKESRARADRLDTESNRRWNIQNERATMAADLGNQVKREQLQQYKGESSANIWASTMTGADGKPLDFTRLSPEELQAKNAQITQVINNTPELKAQLANNPDVDPDNPLAEMRFLYDQKTKQPSAVFTLRMRDGSVKPLTELRSGAPDDQVMVMPLSELDSQVKSLLGSKGALGERKATAAKMATEARKFERDKELAQIRATEKGIKIGTGRDFASGIDNYGDPIKNTKVWNGKDWVTPEDFTAAQQPGGGKGGGAPAPASPGGAALPTYDDYLSRAKQIAKSKGMDWTDEMEQEGRRRFDSKYGKSTQTPKKKTEKPAKSGQKDTKPAEKKGMAVEPEKKPKPKRMPQKKKAPVVNQSPLSISDDDRKRGGGIKQNVVDMAASVSPGGKRTVTASVRDAIKNGDSRSLRKMNQKTLIQVAENLEPEERDKLRKMMGINISESARLRPNTAMTMQTGAQ